MSVRQVAFETVFDGAVQFAPKAIVRHSLQALVAERHLSLVTDSDGLDVFSAVPMVLDAEQGLEVKFALWRHRGNPEGTFAIHLALPQLDVPGFLDSILKELKISDQAVLWKVPDRTNYSTDNNEFEVVAAYETIDAANAVASELIAAGVPSNAITVSNKIDLSTKIDTGIYGNKNRFWAKLLERFPHEEESIFDFLNSGTLGIVSLRHAGVNKENIMLIFEKYSPINFQEQIHANIFKRHRNTASISDL